jgi:sugar (pentulose or hexulose) kinase
MSHYVIGADIGSSGLKAALVHAQAGVVAVAERSYPMHRPFPGAAENDPEDWFNALASATSELLIQTEVSAGDIAGLCVVGQRDVAVLLDEHGVLLAPCIHWTDRRDPKGTAELYDRLGRQRLVDVCGTQPIPGLILPNLAWTRVHQPDVWRKVRHALTPKDYLGHRLTGDIGTDPTGPTRSMLNDWRTQDWSDEICCAAEIPRSILPEVKYRPADVRGHLTPEAAQALGLRAGTPVTAGGGDDPASALGSGVVEPGDVSIGTSSSMSWRVVADHPVHDVSGLMGLMPHLVPDRHIHEMVITGSGTTLRWFRETFAPASTYAELIAEAAAVPPGADGLLCFPYLEGMTVPVQDDSARAVFHGISGRHSRAHFTRAILEGIAYQYPRLLSVIDAMGLEVLRLTTCDGEARNATWNQIKSDVMNRAMTPTLRAEAPAIGAAMLAGISAGFFGSLQEAIGLLVDLAPPVEPDPTVAVAYAEHRERWLDVEQQLLLTDSVTPATLR